VQVDKSVEIKFPAELLVETIQSAKALIILEVHTPDRKVRWLIQKERCHRPACQHRKLHVGITTASTVEHRHGHSDIAESGKPGNQHSLQPLRVIYCYFRAVVHFFA
jgi:hypothetical protein